MWNDLKKVRPARLLKQSVQHLNVHRWTYTILWNIHRWYTAGIIACAFLSGLTPVILFISLRGLIDDQVSSDGKNSFRWLMLLLIVGVIEVTIGLASRLFRTLLREIAFVDIYELILKHSLKLSIASFESSETQNLFENFRGNCAEKMVDLVGRNSQVIASMLQISTISFMLARIEPLILLALPPCFFSFLWYQLQSSSVLMSRRQRQHTERRRVNYFINLLTSPYGVAETRILGIAEHLIKNFREAGHANREMEIRRSVRQFLSGLIFSTVCTVVFVGLIARILHQRDAAGAALGSVVFFAVASIRLRKSLEDTTISFATLAEHAEYISCAKRFLTETKVEPRQPLHAPGTSFSPEISFENVSFRYEGQQHDALRNITFTIKAGETIAIVGENGSGKSTLVRLIAGIYQPQSGTIRISGHDISRIDLQSLHQQIAFVFQDFNRYYTSLLENLAYGDWSRYSQYPQGTLWQELQPCVMSAGLGNELKKMPRAEETILGRSQGEYEPSGGIWQRIAIARAFARQARLLIMDEPSSAIDARAEYEMFRTISSLAEGRTTILISHRFSTVSMASRIFVMEAGQLVEAGGHEELMQLNGRYATLYNYHRVLQAGE